MTANDLSAEIRARDAERIAADTLADKLERAADAIRCGDFDSLAAIALLFEEAAAALRLPPAGVEPPRYSREEFERDRMGETGERLAEERRAIDAKLAAGVEAGSPLRALIAELRDWTDEQAKNARLFMFQANHIEELLNKMEALLSAPVASGWQPIATAPKDGTTILIWDGVDQMVSRCIGPAESDWATLALCVQPTHWMPLPAAPVASDKATP